MEVADRATLGEECVNSVLLQCCRLVEIKEENGENMQTSCCYALEALNEH